MDAELLFVEVLLLGYALLEKVEMVVRHSEVDVRLPIGTGIQCPFHEMLLERCADAVIVAVEEQEPLRQLSVVETLGIEQVGYDSLVLPLTHKRTDVLMVVGHALIVERVVERKRLDIREKGLLEIGLRCVIIGIEECKHILEHAAGGAGGWHELHHLVACLLVSLPLVDGFLLSDRICHENAFADSGS